jgi:hypothetical protein
MRHFALLLAVICICVSLPFWPGTWARGQVSDTTCPYFPAYGGVYTTSGERVVSNGATRADLLRQVLDCTKAHMTAAELAQYDERIQALSTTASTPTASPEGVLLSIELASAIGADPAIREQDEVARRLFTQRVADVDIRVIAEAAGFLDRLESAGWKGLDQSSIPIDHQPDYTNDCKGGDEPVTIPPTISSGLWTKVPVSSTDPWMFSTSDPTAWTFADANGFCVALERDVGSQAAIGTICTNRKQTRACFFDSVAYVGQVITPLPLKDALDADYASLVHPQDLTSLCNTCHIGDNPFIVNPLAPLGHAVAGLEQAYTDTTTVKPWGFEFVDAAPVNWTDPPPLHVSGNEAACMSCHDFPARDTGEYCTIVLSRAGGLFMPPRWAASGGTEFRLWPDACGCPEMPVPWLLQGYVASVHRLQQMCQPLDPPPDCAALKTGVTKQCSTGGNSGQLSSMAR